MISSARQRKHGVSKLRGNKARQKIHVGGIAYYAGRPGSELSISIALAMVFFSRIRSSGDEVRREAGPGTMYTGASARPA